MGSTFDYILIPKAAEYLKVTCRSVYNYINKGHLRTIKEGAKIKVLREDVHTLKKLKDRSDLPYPVNKLTVARLDARIQMLETMMETVTRILDLRHERLDLSDAQLKSLYVMAQHHLIQGWAPHDEHVWMDTFIRITLEDFEELQKVIGDENPWRPFHQLCKALLQTPYDVDNKLQFNAGKANLERIIHVWTSTRGKTAKVVSRIIDKDDKAVRKIVRRRTPKDENPFAPPQQQEE